MYDWKNTYISPIHSSKVKSVKSFSHTNTRNERRRKKWDLYSIRESYCVLTQWSIFEYIIRKIGSFIKLNKKIAYLWISHEIWSNTEVLAVWVVFLMRKKSIQYLKELLDTFPVSKDHLEYKTGLGLPIQFPNGTCNVRSLWVWQLWLFSNLQTASP